MTDGLLLLHAFPLDASMWAPQLAAYRQALAAREDREVPVVAPNAPGFGGSPISAPVTHMDAIADEAARQLAEAGCERAVVCGLSMGGYAALAFWRRYRGRVAGMVLANTRAGADDEAGRGRRRALADRLRSEGSAFLVAEPPPLLSVDASPELWERVRSIIAAQPAEAIAAASLGMAERPDSTGDLSGIDVPVLVVTSAGDSLIPSEATAAMAERIPGAELAVIEGAGHLSNLEAPEEFNRLLFDHLARCGVLPA